MINIILGAPGGGKSYEAVSYHILPAIEAGRKVITNLPLNIERFEAILPGASKLIEVRTATLAKSPDEKMAYSRLGFRRAETGFVNRPFANPEDYQDTWRDENGRGPLYVIDECHFCLPSKGTSKDVEEWYSMHRHYNVDVLLITQSYSKVNKPIIDLVQVCYKVRKATAFGNSGGYIRKVHDGVRGGEVSTQQRKYQSKFYKLYKSHTQGTALQEADAADVTPFIVKFNRFKWAWVALSVVLVGWAFWPKGERQAKEKEKGEMQKISKAPANNRLVPDEPLKGKGLHLVGSVGHSDKTVYIFSVTNDGKKIFTMNSEELAELGYRWRSLSYCTGSLYYKGIVRTVVCDAPTPALADARGSRSDKQGDPPEGWGSTLAQ